MTTVDRFDAVVIGGGPGGVTAALRLTAHGLTVALIEDRLVGGECHYWACNPTKTLIRPIEVRRLAAAVPGVREVMTSRSLDVEAVFAKRDAIIDHLVDHDIVTGLKQAGIDVIHGRGRLDGERTVVVTEPDGRQRRLHAEHAVVLATGTSPFIPDIDGLRSAAPWTNRELATMTRVPARSIVVGGGVVGVESATILSGLGSDVTLLARGPALLQGSEPFAGERVARGLQDRGVEVRVDSTVSSVTRHPSGAVSVVTADTQLDADEIVVATGRSVNTDDVGLETVGLPAGEFVAVDDHLTATGVDGEWLYAIGDTTGRALLSHVSQYHAGIVADIVAHRARGGVAVGAEMAAQDRGHLPQIIFTDPQVVEVGYTEKAARASGFTVATRSAHYPGEIGELSILRDGFDAEAKLVIDADRDTLLGATFVGPDIADLVHAATVAVVGKVPLSVLRHAIAPHPSLSQVWNPLLAAR
ncbi:NAD(P)/FAD-dependent oxidoreductase [Mycolicibacterium sp. 018/SC-01/001]|uniref:dihydrolipoyl dehydrogenase family protein n=1 Tax=Mycolicibacterium sp. 018/SC-01/001 TaxID=2592069 RepID=UPI00117F4F4E|nr:NAD(P)/FAD-dependent oxidoreductase [Mycolicibacterium sp. 018/SC-01/001]TRW82133.1 NAD(P)/FAD-dependent oxidoreductase [Mycolicibacterium sp. 018/SC-01/001]